MIWFKLALALLKITGAVLDHLERRRLIGEGERRQILKARKAMDDALDRAALARSAVDHSADSVSNDEFNRDRD